MKYIYNHLISKEKDSNWYADEHVEEWIKRITVIEREEVLH